MLKDIGYQEKFVMLKNWVPEILETVKKDLKNEHLKVDRSFCKKYFLGKGPSQIQVQEMVEPYQQEIAQGNVGLGEFIATRWLLKNTDIYGLFEEKLKAITVDFETLVELPGEIANPLMKEAVAQFGAKRTYLFSVFNSVVFPKKIYDELKELALSESSQETTQKNEENEKKTLESLQRRHAREIQNLNEKYEKKFEGLQKKYLHDIAVCKKQLSDLQKKFDER